jgi:hypothetical protein
MTSKPGNYVHVRDRVNVALHHLPRKVSLR